VRRVAIVCAAVIALAVALPTRAEAAASQIAGSPIEHVVVVLQENRTFDNMFHGYPGADYATTAPTSTGGTVALMPVHLMTPWDPSHTYKSWVTEYNGGAMNGFDLDTVAGSGAPPNAPYAYAMQSDVQPYWDLAKEGVLADATFADHRSQTFAGHLFPIAGASGPIAPDLPDYYASGNPPPFSSCAFPGKGRAVDILTGKEDKTYVSCLDIRTIADLLDARGLSWKMYVDSLERPTFMSSFSVIRRIAEGPEFATNVVSPETTIMQDLQDGTLPAVSYVVGAYANSDHPGQNVPSSNGPRYVTAIFNAIGASRYWKNTVVMLVYDDWGGWYDHVKPQTFNAFEAGFRIPLIVESPYAKRGYISHRTHYVGSILHFIEKNWNLGSLHTSDARSDALDDCFDYRQTPLSYVRVNAGNALAVLVDADLPWYAPTPPDPEDRD
jgi:phospholipase C